MIGIVIKVILLKKHRAAIREHGTTPYHRMTFNLLGTDPQLEIPF